jgi:hypothetical protein
MRFGGLICLWPVIGSMVMPEKMHQRTSEQKLIGGSAKRVARMRRQQVNAERRRDKSSSQPKPGAEKTSECAHTDSDCQNHHVAMMGSRYQAVLRSL